MPAYMARYLIVLLQVELKLQWKNKCVITLSLKQKHYAKCKFDTNNNLNKSFTPDILFKLILCRYCICTLTTYNKKTSFTTSRVTFLLSKHLSCFMKIKANVMSTTLGFPYSYINLSKTHFAAHETPQFLLNLNA